MTEILGINLKETEDVLIRDVLAATAAQIDCGAGINGDNPTELTFDDILQTTQTLFNNNAKSIAMVVEGADKFGTAPVRNAFFALGSTQLQASLNNIDGFIPTAQYPNQSSVLVSEFGSVGYTRWLLSSNGSVTANASALGNNVFNNFIVGMESYGTINQDNYSSKFLYIPPEIIGGPLALYGALGWKKAVANRILNDSWLYNLRCTIA